MLAANEIYVHQIKMGRFRDGLLRYYFDFLEIDFPKSHGNFSVFRYSNPTSLNFMATYWHRKIVSLVYLVTFSCSACAQQADFNEVGKQMAIRLQNSHFARLPFDEGLSQRFLDNYLKNLDPQHLYFTRVDIDEFLPALKRSAAVDEGALGAIAGSNSQS